MNKERTIEEINQEILKVTNKIQEEFPEVYNVLPETPLAPAAQEKKVEAHEYEQYLEAVKKQLETLRHNQAIQTRNNDAAGEESNKATAQPVDEHADPGQPKDARQ